MRKFLLAAAFLALTPALAQAAPPPAEAHARELHRDVVQDRHEVRQERRELRHARRDLHRDQRQLHRARARAWHRHHHG